MPRQPLNTDDLQGSREIRLLDRQESNYPNLMRMCMDFNFQVIQLQRKVSSDETNHCTLNSRAFVLTINDYRTDKAATITPVCDSMRKLEDYVTQHQVDILHEHLFGLDDDELTNAR